MSVVELLISGTNKLGVESLFNDTYMYFRISNLITFLRMVIGSTIMTVQTMTMNPVSPEAESQRRFRFCCSAHRAR